MQRGELYSSYISKEKYDTQRIGDFEISAKELQPIRFQGQTSDVETGLHYNRFRYYDPDMGMFISRDPIGLMGGENVFAYAPNPTGWVDPLGLSGSASTVIRQLGSRYRRFSRSCLTDAF